VIISSGGRSDPVQGQGAGCRVVAAFDVEWSKNYRIRNGNIPFCYSAVWLSLPGGDGPADVAGMGFHYTSAYVENPGETADLIAEADAAAARMLKHADLIAGHQLCSDLAVLDRASARTPAAMGELRAAWKGRRTGTGHRPRIVDTRYDTGHVLAGASRRLVDVCGELGLDVTQPELRGTSMTALHRRWLDTGDRSAREKISVLNLRHSLSTALTAMRAAGTGGWDRPLNVNQMLAAGLGEEFAWTSSPAFRALL
jgi:hypothetical protein